MSPPAAGNGLYDALRTRRVTRQMSDEPVDPELLDQVVRPGPASCAGS